MLTVDETAREWVGKYGKDAPAMIRKGARHMKRQEKFFMQEVEAAAKAILSEQTRTARKRS